MSGYDDRRFGGEDPRGGGGGYMSQQQQHRGGPSRGPPGHHQQRPAFRPYDSAGRGGRDSGRDGGRDFRRGNDRGRDDHQHRDGGGRGGRGRAPLLDRDEANSRERPCRRLFIRNASFQVTEREMRDIFGEFGDIKDFTNLISNRGICFLSFYDLRGADAARRNLNDTPIRGRNVTIHFSLPKEADVRGDCDRDRDQGTLSVTLRGSKGPFDQASVRSFFERFGQVMNVVDTLDPMRKFVEYYDSRDCAAAFDAVSENGAFMDGKLEIEFVWDQFTSLPPPANAFGGPPIGGPGHQHLGPAPSMGYPPAVPIPMPYQQQPPYQQQQQSYNQPPMPARGNPPMAQNGGGGDFNALLQSRLESFRSGPMPAPQGQPVQWAPPTQQQQQQPQAVLQGLLGSLQGAQQQQQQGYHQSPPGNANPALDPNQLQQLLNLLSASQKK